MRETRAHGTRMTGGALAALAVAAMGIGGCGGTRDAGSASATTATSATSGRAETTAARRPATPIRLRTVARRRLPAPVQLPGVARLGDGTVLAVGGLDAADALRRRDRAASPRARPRRGRPPAAAPPTTSARRRIARHGLRRSAAARARRAARRRSSRSGRAAPRAPPGACRSAMSDTSAAAIGATAYVVGGYTATTPLRSVLAFRPGRAVRRRRHAAAPAALRRRGRGRRPAAGRRRDGRRPRAARDPVASIRRRHRVRVVARLPRAAGARRRRGARRAFYVLGGRGDAPDSPARGDLGGRPGAARRGAPGRLPVALSDLARRDASAAASSSSGGRDARGTRPRRALVAGGRMSLRRSHRSVRGAAASRCRLPRAAGCGGDGPTASAADRVRRRARGRGASHRGRPPATRRPAPRRAHPAAGLAHATSTPPTGRAARAAACAATPRASTSRTRSRTPSTSSTSARGASSATSPSARCRSTSRPSWDLRTLWVTNDRGNSLTPIDPRTGAPRPAGPGRAIRTTSTSPPTAGARSSSPRRTGRSTSASRTRCACATRCASRSARASTTWTSPPTAAGRSSRASSPAGWSSSTCVRERVAARRSPLRPGAMPQDVKLSPDGRTFYVADMASNGVWLIDARTLRA